MNYLAHIYLSFDNDEITLGNFIADSIRGNRFGHLPQGIQKGIILHRAIDTYTDAHPTVRNSTKRLHQNYSHYSRVIVDIFYDHFLAVNWVRYSQTPLAVFVDRFYDLLKENFTILPEGTQRMMPYMMADNWLLNYAKMEGIAKVLNGMNRRTQHKSKMNLAILDLEVHYNEFQTEFFSFFEELIIFSKEKFDSL